MKAIVKQLNKKQEVVLDPAKATGSGVLLKTCAKDGNQFGIG